MRAHLAAVALVAGSAAHAAVIVAEGESFVPRDDKGWKVTHQDESYASHTYGGMWVSGGGLLGAPAGSAGSLATREIDVPERGEYRVWSKYQAPPYFSYHHGMEIAQGGQVVFSHTYGKIDAKRLWSFAGAYKMRPISQCWWPWGVDHDAAEAPVKTARLEAGKAVLRLITHKSPEPAGGRFVDFVVLTTEQADTYKGYQPYRSGTPFAIEACEATKLYMRFGNPAGAPARLKVSRRGHFQPNYGSAKVQVPEAPVAPGEWSPWINIGPFCRLVHDEGLWFTLPGAERFDVHFARDDAGRDIVGELEMKSGEAVTVPIDICWRKGARVTTSRERARGIIELTKTWRKANRGRKPGHVLFYGDFRGREPWLVRLNNELKDALGYNTGLPDEYDHVARDGKHCHARNASSIRKVAAKIVDKDSFRILSFGDEIGLGRVKFDDPDMQEKFREWLASKRLTRKDLGVAPREATLVREGHPRLAWYSELFSQEERFTHYRSLTELARREIGPHVLTGANYSPHHLALYYGPVHKWVDIFKHGGMTMFWSEDYIFSVPEVPQIISWTLAEARCGVKYRGQPIHFYVMPHAPGQEPGYLRRNTLACVGAGASHIDNFWIAPQEQFTENYVSWGRIDMFRAIHEAIYDTAEAEAIQHGGKVRPARVGVVLSKATDFNESRLMVERSKDPFASRCENAPEKINQIICRKDQQLLYLALRHAEHAVELITEDDIVEGCLARFDAVHFAGEWIDHRAVKPLDIWVKGGGVLYACAGLGRMNEFGEPERAMMKLLGLTSCSTEKNAYVLRTLLELPLVEPVGTIAMDGDRIPAVGMKQTLVPSTARVLGTWGDGSAAVTVREYGKGKAFAVGTLAGATYMKTGLRPVPFARGGRKNLYNPVAFDPAAAGLAHLAVNAAGTPHDIVFSKPNVEGFVIDHETNGSLVTLVNWTNGPVADLAVRVRLPARPADVRSVERQKSLDWAFENGEVRFTTDLAEADFILLLR